MSNFASDRLDPLSNNFALTARAFFTGAWCRVAVFEGKSSAGHFHLPRSERVSVKNRVEHLRLPFKRTLLSATLSARTAS